MDHHNAVFAFEFGMLVLALLAAAAQAHASAPPPPPPEVTFADLDPLVQNVAVWTVQLAPPQDREVRVDTYDGRSNRTGYILIDRTTGRFDRFDANSRHTGTGRITPPPASGTVPPRLRFDWNTEEGRR